MNFKHVNEHIFYLLDWLEMRYGSMPGTICVNVMNGFPAVEGMTGSGFGAYVNGGEIGKPIILIAGEAPAEIESEDEREFFCKVFLHEFRHHIQYLDNPSSVFADDAEDDANEFAEFQYAGFLSWLGV